MKFKVKIEFHWRDLNSSKPSYLKTCCFLSYIWQSLGPQQNVSLKLQPSHLLNCILGYFHISTVSEVALVFLHIVCDYSAKIRPSPLINLNEGRLNTMSTNKSPDTSGRAQLDKHNLLFGLYKGTQAHLSMGVGRVLFLLHF